MSKTLNGGSRAIIAMLSGIPGRKAVSRVGSCLQASCCYDSLDCSSMEMCVCRCCLAAGCDKDLLSAYQHRGVREVYADMMRETFGIEFPTDLDTHYICDDCIMELRLSSEFKKRTLSSSAIFLQHIHQLNKDTGGKTSPTEVKEESDDDSESDYFEVEVLDETLEEYMLQSSINTRPKIMQDSERTMKRKQDEFEPTSELKRYKKEIEKRKQHVTTGKQEVETENQAVNTEKEDVKTENQADNTEKEGIKTENQEVKTEGPVSDSEFIEQDDDDTHDEETEVAEKRTRLPSDKVLKRIENAVTVVAHSNACPFHWPLMSGMRFKCYCCPTHFMDFQELRTHFVAEHYDIEAFRREVCRQGVASPLKIEITGLACAVCGRACAGLAALRAHLACEHHLHLHTEEEVLLPLECEGDGYKCLECATEFPGWVSLNRHVRVTHRVATPRVHECRECEKRFLNRKSLRQHMHSAHTDGMRDCKALQHNTLSLLDNSNMTVFHYEGVTFRCVMCPHACIHFAELLQHVAAHDSAHLQAAVRKSPAISRYCIKVDITDLQCTKCQQPFDSIDALRDHLTDAHGTVFYKNGINYLVPYLVNGCMKCGVCKKDFTVMQTLTRHVNSHVSKEICEICGKAYYNKTLLRTHVRKTHSEIKCALCEVTFESHEARRVHNKVQHKGQQVNKKKSNSCPFCKETFSYSEPKFVHMKRAHGYQPPEYTCQVCSRVFHTKAYFDTHQHSHKRVGSRATKWVSCKHCSLKFSERQLAKHMAQWHVKSHTFRCYLCKDEFESADLLRRHLIDRHRERKPQCPLCAFVPKGKAILLLHLEAVHKIDNTIDGVWTFESGALVNVKPSI